MNILKHDSFEVRNSFVIKYTTIIRKLFHSTSENTAEYKLKSFVTEVPIICRANQWTGFYMIGTFVMKALMWVMDAYAHTQGERERIGVTRKKSIA